jgi:hypothetical protein
MVLTAPMVANGRQACCEARYIASDHQFAAITTQKFSMMRLNLPETVCLLQRLPQAVVVAGPAGQLGCGGFSRMSS